MRDKVRGTRKPDRRFVSFIEPTPDLCPNVSTALTGPYRNRKQSFSVSPADSFDPKNTFAARDGLFAPPGNQALGSENHRAASWRFKDGPTSMTPLNMGVSSGGGSVRKSE
jgi:hypothetical protein